MNRRERFVRWWSESDWEGRDEGGIGYRRVDGRAVLSDADVFKARVRYEWREWRGRRKNWRCWPSVCLAAVLILVGVLGPWSAPGAGDGTEAAAAAEQDGGGASGSSGDAGGASGSSGSGGSYVCPPAPDSFTFSSRTTDSDGNVFCDYTRSGSTTRTAATRTIYTCPTAPLTFTLHSRDGTTCKYTRGTSTSRTATSRTTYTCPRVTDYTNTKGRYDEATLYSTNYITGCVISAVLRDEAGDGGRVST